MSSFVTVIVMGFGARGSGLLHRGRAAFCISIFGEFIFDEGSDVCYEEGIKYLACLEHWGFYHIRMMVIDFFLLFFFSGLQQSSNLWMPDHSWQVTCRVSLPVTVTGLHISCPHFFSDCNSLMKTCCQGDRDPEIIKWGHLWLAKLLSSCRRLY